jgi:hypothetical protein
MPRFFVDYTISGRATATIEADSMEEARAKVEEEAYAEDFDIDLDAIDDVDFRIQELHPVTRDGKEIWTTYVRDSDKRGHQSAIDNSPLFAEH